MSATGETPLTESDGTQAPFAQDAFADPLSGLVTAGAPARSVAEEFERLRIADPVQPDPDTVREMVNAAMLAENAEYGRPLQPTVIQPQVNGSSFVPGQTPLGIIPQQRTWPVRPPQLLRTSRKPRPQRVAAEPIEESEAAKPKRDRRRIRPGKPSSNSTGVIIAVALMIVFAIVVIQLLVSLFSSIAGIFA